MNPAEFLGEEEYRELAARQPSFRQNHYLRRVQSMDQIGLH